MKDDNDEDLAEAVCRIAGGAVPGGMRRRRWNEEVQRMKEVMKIAEEVGIVYPHTSNRSLSLKSRHRVLEAVPGMLVDLAAKRASGAGWDLSNNYQYSEAKRRVKAREGMLLLECHRHVAKWGEDRQ